MSPPRSSRAEVHPPEEFDHLERLRDFDTAGRAIAIRLLQGEVRIAAGVQYRSAAMSGCRRRDISATDPALQIDVVPGRDVVQGRVEIRPSCHAWRREEYSPRS